MKKSQGFTLIEVIVAIFIFSLLSISFLLCLKFSIDAHTVSVKRYKLVLQGESALEDVIDDMKNYDASEITPPMISSIAHRYSDDHGDYYVSIKQTTHDNLYIGEIIFRESRYERLCTQIHLP